MYLPHLKLLDHQKLLKLKYICVRRFSTKYNIGSNTPYICLHRVSILDSLRRKLKIVNISLLMGHQALKVF